MKPQITPISLPWLPSQLHFPQPQDLLLLLGETQISRTAEKIRQVPIKGLFCWKKDKLLEFRFRRTLGDWDVRTLCGPCSPSKIGPRSTTVTHTFLAISSIRIKKQVNLMMIFYKQTVATLPISKEKRATIERDISRTNLKAKPEEFPGSGSNEIPRLSSGDSML